MHVFLGGNLVRTFRVDVVFTPIWSHVNENENYRKKANILNVDKTVIGLEIWWIGTCQ